MAELQLSSSTNQLGAQIFDVKEYVQQVSALTEPMLESLRAENNPFWVNLLVIKQQLNIMSSELFEIQGIINTRPPENKVSKTVPVLQAPNGFKRKRNVRRKKITYGVMTADEVLETFAEEDRKKEVVLKEKEARKEARELKKAMKEKILNMKKEKNEQKNKIQPKKIVSEASWKKAKSKICIKFSYFYLFFTHTMC